MRAGCGSTRNYDASDRNVTRILQYRVFPARPGQRIGNSISNGSRHWWCVMPSPFDSPQHTQIPSHRLGAGARTVRPNAFRRQSSGANAPCRGNRLQLAIGFGHHAARGRALREPAGTAGCGLPLHRGNAADTAAAGAVQLLAVRAAPGRPCSSGPSVQLRAVRAAPGRPCSSGPSVQLRAVRAAPGRPCSSWPSVQLRAVRAAPGRPCSSGPSVQLLAVSAAPGPPCSSVPSVQLRAVRAAPGRPCSSGPSVQLRAVRAAPGRPWRVEEIGAKSWPATMAEARQSLDC